MGVFKTGFVRNKEESNLSDFNFQEQKEVPFFRFEKRGDLVEGYLISLDPMNVGENKTRTIAYTLELFKGGRLRFLGTKNILDKLTPAMLGRPVRVKYQGDDEKAGKNGNAMRIFWVGVDWDDKNKRNDLIVTDEDVAAWQPQ